MTVALIKSATFGAPPCIGTAAGFALATAGVGTDLTAAGFATTGGAAAFSVF